jgi:hypothetical protein
MQRLKLKVIYPYLPLSALDIKSSMPCLQLEILTYRHVGLVGFGSPCLRIGREQSGLLTFRVRGVVSYPCALWLDQTVSEAESHF